MTRHTVPYGSTPASFEARELEGRAVVTIDGSTTGPAREAAAVLRDALERTVGPRLRDLARGAHSAVVLVPGIDRVAGVGRYVPLLLDELLAAGVPKDRTTVYLATGTHHHNGARDLRTLLGDEVASTVPSVVHDPRDESGLVDLGTTSRGTPVKLSRKVAEADVKVLTGRVIPHYFAGFGGGRKALVPGVASLATIFANHKLTLAPEVGIAAHVDACSLEKNPVHLDMLEAARRARPTFALSTLLDTAHGIVDAVAGEPEASHLLACRRATELHQRRVEAPFDALVTSAGGSPYDCSFVQALKALFNVRDVVREGGAVLWIAECREGIAPTFLKWAKVKDEAELEREARRAYDLGAHNTIMLRALLSKVRIALVSSLDPEHVRSLGVEPRASVREGLEWLESHTRAGARVGLVPHANVTHAALRI